METEPQTPILNTVEVYDPKTDSWSFRKPMPVKRSGHCAVLAADGKIYILGGSEVLDVPLNTVFIYDPEKDSWEKGPNMILPRDVLAAVATPDGKIYAIGGTDVGAYEDKAQWEHLASLIPEDELGDYKGKVQDTVETLDIFKWRKYKENK
jgi:N-acetylneuraminic acid mutarotase